MTTPMHQVERPFGGGTNAQVALGVLFVGTALYIWWATGNPSRPPPRPVPSMYEGAMVDAPITLVTSDKFDLSCALGTEVEGFQCEYASPETLRGAAGKDMDAQARKKLLAPYKTIDDVLYLIPGLFEEPAVEERYQDEPPTRKPKEKLQRFTAQCKLKLVKQVEGVRMRWHTNETWKGPQRAWIGVPSSCQVSEP